MSRTIAVVGSGPSGCYLVQSLRKKAPEADLVVFDRLPVPYGLIRYGVAADHQGTKALTEQFDRLFTREGVRFVGNVDVGGEVTLEALQEAFDVVVLATGVDTDRHLGIVGEDNSCLYRAGRVTRLFNGYPDESREGFELGARVVIVGNGNVALDIVRLLCKTEHDFAGSDIDDSFRNDVVGSIREINVVGRRGVTDVRFDKALVKELGRIGDVSFRLYGADEVPHGLDPIQQSKVDDLRQLRSIESSSSRVRVNFHFGWAAESITETSEGVSMTFRASRGPVEHLTIATDSVITAVGFVVGYRDRWNRDSLLSPDADVAHGKLASGLYCTGWFGKGAQGTIPEHRIESKALASMIVNEIETLPTRSEKTGLAALPQDMLDNFVDFAGWNSIDAVERASARYDRFRRKLITTEELLSAARDVKTGLVKGASV